MSDPILTARDVCVGYGRGDIVRDVSMDVVPGRIATIIGPNGAGKSTMLKAVAGVLKPRTGSIMIDGAELAGLPASRVARHGVSYVPQDANVFRQLTVAENMEMGAWIDRSNYDERLERVLTLFPDLKERWSVRAGSLSGGQRQMVAFGMALLVEPRVLLLDEPSAGLSPMMVDQMFETVRRVNETGIAVLMVEQNAVQALRISDHGYVMAAGAVAMSASADRLLHSEEVSDLYLGTRQ